MGIQAVNTSADDFLSSPENFETEQFDFSFSDDQAQDDSNWTEENGEKNVWTRNIKQCIWKNNSYSSDESFDAISSPTKLTEKTNDQNLVEQLIQRHNAWEKHVSQQVQYYMQNVLNPLQKVLNEEFQMNMLRLAEKQEELKRQNPFMFQPHTFIWSGKLPIINKHQNVTYSQKVFLGGLPWYISEMNLQKMFEKFGKINVEWPCSEKHTEKHRKGYAFIIFDSQQAIKELMKDCEKKFGRDGKISYFYSGCYDLDKNLNVEIVPWIVQDLFYSHTDVTKASASSTVFMGGLHGKFTAEVVAKIMNDLFGNVACVGIDCDKYKYPIGSARVTFSKASSFMRAVAAKFIQIKTDSIDKRVQIDPFLEETLCSFCGFHRGQYFCPELVCFRYYCFQCWTLCHANNFVQNHTPLIRYSGQKPKDVSYGEQHKRNNHHHKKHNRNKKFR